MFGNAVVALPPGDWGKRVDPLRRNLRMAILRTPHNVVPEPNPELVAWKPFGITPNAQIVSLSGAASDAIATLDRAGPRGAAVLGAAAGLLLTENRLMGLLVGGMLGYFGGAYITNFAKKMLAAQQVVSTVASVVSTKAST
jgi:hypothetical protein